MNRWHDRKRTCARGRRRISLVALIAVVLSTVYVGSASAERAVLTPSAALPWSDPAHQTPTELLASSITSQIAQRPARAHCHSAGEWASLGFHPNSLGVVRYLYSLYSYRIVQVEDIAHLHENVCASLKSFGEAASKPTRCATTETVERTVYETVQVKKKVFYWKKVRLKDGTTKRVRKSKYVWTTKRVARTVTETIPGPSVPCYGSGQALPFSYRANAVSMHVLGHEAVHIFDFYVGAQVQTQESAESRAECYGMQFIGPVAHAFGADEDDARALAKYYWDFEYPRMQGTPYWRPDCQPGSSFDLSPSDGFWPSVTADTWFDPGPFVWETVEYRDTSIAP